MDQSSVTALSMRFMFFMSSSEQCRRNSCVLQAAYNIMTYGGEMGCW